MLAAAPARGAEVTRVVSAMDGENRFDFNLTASWLHEIRSASIKRELESSYPSDLIKDSVFSQTRDLLSLRADFGILWDVGLHIELPIVLQDSSSLDFDRSGGNCSYPETVRVDEQPRCVDSGNSTVLRDGILPGYQMDSWGLDAEHNRPYTRTSVPGPANLFKGPTRKGLESLNVGITWAPFNQRRDDTKPTWTLSFDAKLDVFKDKRFDPSNAMGNTAVGPGYHQFIW